MLVYTVSGRASFGASVSVTQSMSGMCGCVVGGGSTGLSA